MQFYQGDIIKINDYKKQLFVVVSKNAFIRATGMIHVCPFIKNSGTVICEQIKAIDPAVRACSKTDCLSYKDIMDVSDTIQGIIEYD